MHSTIQTSNPTALRCCYHFRLCTHDLHRNVRPHIAHRLSQARCYVACACYRRVCARALADAALTKPNKTYVRTYVCSIVDEHKLLCSTATFLSIAHTRIRAYTRTFPFPTRRDALLFASHDINNKTHAHTQRTLANTVRKLNDIKSNVSFNRSREHKCTQLTSTLSHGHHTTHTHDIRDRVCNMYYTHCTSLAVCVCL